MAARWRRGGFSLVEVLVAATILLVAAMMGVTHVIRANQHLDWVRDQGFAREKAVSILDELRTVVEGGDGEVAADLDGFDDGVSQSPVLTISLDPDRDGALVPPGHPTSGNVRNQDAWRFWRRVSVRPYGSVESRDLRFVTVRVYRALPGQDAPGDQLAEVSSIIRTLGDAFPTSQVYDLYLLALENAPGWWVDMDVIQPFVEAVLTDLEGRNRGLVFRTHWITKLGYGRDDEYAPYTNESRISTDRTPWTYVYPGRMPEGEAASRYYVPGRFDARVNLDGEDAPVFRNGLAPSEPYEDTNGNGRYDPGESFTDFDGDEFRDAGNPMPYALADMHNHCMRWPEAQARFESRVAAGTDDSDAPTWRLLLDRMVAEPEHYQNAILINMHGELLPMPPARNVSDPAKDPESVPGWRAVTHPERLRPRRVPGSDTLSDTPRFRVYAWKTAFDGSEVVTTQAEPFEDLDGDGTFDEGEVFTDWNGNGTWDAGRPLTLRIRDGDFSALPNDDASPTLRVLRLAGGVDADGDGSPEPYEDWVEAPCYPETWTDVNGDGMRQVVELFLDLNGDGVWGDGEPFSDRDGDGAFSAADELLEDANGNGVWDVDRPAEAYTDANGNGRWDSAEPYWDLDEDGVWTPPTAPKTPWVAWSPAYLGDTSATTAYVAAYGEPFRDLDSDRAWDDAEAFFDANRNGVRDGGFERGEMWFSVESEVASVGTVVCLHGTPLETPYDSATQRGLPASARLYDLEYIPCPTPDTVTGTDRFARDLHMAHDSHPKNTARWIVELPLDAVRTAFESGGLAQDGDAEDRILTIETRIGRELQTGVLWPTRNAPQNLSVTHAWFFADASDVPYSERHQFLGDPRHAPYADMDAQGTTTPHGYNWFFDDFDGASGNAQSEWPAFDAARLEDGWLGRGGGHDVPRLMAWLRQAVTRTAALYTTLTGFSYYYLSVGGDVGSDSANGFPNSVPMDGLPFGLSSDVHENTITDGGGDSAIKGSLKYVRGNTGVSAGMRADGYWWSKPWLGELFEDEAYASQWKLWGNLRAGTANTSGSYRLCRRGDVTTAQQPQGTELANRYSRLSEEGCTSFFNIGTSAQTFHHQYASGTGDLVDQGSQIAFNYHLTIPETSSISRPFGLATSSSGGVGPEFGFTDAFPRYSGNLLTRFYDHTSGQTGSGLVQLTEPGTAPSSGYIVVNGIDRTLESGSAHIARYAVVSLLHAFFVAGGEGVPNRVRQIPRVQIKHPTLVAELRNPAAISVRWSTEWTRWDGRPYTEDHASTFAESEGDLRYVLMYSKDGGQTWLHMLDESLAEPGTSPWVGGASSAGIPVLEDAVPGGDEIWLWSVPPDRFPEGSYLVRVETYRADTPLHHAHHMEKIYVER